MKIVLTGGGTGGHFYPGFALAQELRARGWQALFIVKKDPTLTEAQVRGRPVPGVNPIAWLIWHAMRLEDVCVNRFVFDRQGRLLACEHRTRRVTRRRRSCGTKGSVALEQKTENASPRARAKRRSRGASAR